MLLLRLNQSPIAKRHALQAAYAALIPSMCPRSCVIYLQLHFAQSWQTGVATTGCAAGILSLI